MSLFYRVPSSVEETLEWKTNTITSRDGTEQRISLKDSPRSSMDLRYNLIDENKRTEIWKEAQEANTSYDVIMWHHASPVLSASTVGASTVTYDYDMAPVLIGGKVAIVNSSISVIEIKEIDGIIGNEIHFTTPLAFAVPTNFYVCPIFSGYIDTISQSIEGKYGSSSITVKLMDNFILENGSVSSIDYYDSIPVFTNRTMSLGERIGYEKEVIDFEIGSIDLFSPRAHFDGSFDFTGWVRFQDWTSMKKLKKFLNLVKGSFISFLVPSYLNDLSPSGLTANASFFNVPVSKNFWIDNSAEAFKRIEIEYSDGSISRHTISSVVLSSGNYRYNISPNIPNSPKVSNVRRISRLLRVCMADTMRISYSNAGIEFSFSIRTVDN